MDDYLKYDDEQKERSTEMLKAISHMQSPSWGRQGPNGQGSTETVVPAGDGI